MPLIPVTILTGFLGSGKTTLLNRILRDCHGQRIAVIENEFGEAGIDHELLVRDEDQQIVEMNNGCVCCSVRGDFVRILSNLARQRREQLVQFDRVIIETTGLVDPGPVVQTFFMSDEVARSYFLDAIVTMVDAKHAMGQLDNYDEAQKQIAFADRVLISKSELVAPTELTALKQRLMHMNLRAPIKTCGSDSAVLEDLLDIRGFDLTAILEIEPDVLTKLNTAHVAGVSSFVFRSDQPFQMEKLDQFLTAIVQIYGTQIMRYKGLLWIAGVEERIVLQGVHMLMDAHTADRWKNGEKRESCFVFIGKNLPRQLILDGLAECLLVTAVAVNTEGERVFE